MNEGQEMKRYYLVTQYEDSAKHRDLGVDEVAAYAYAAQLVDKMIASGFVVTHWPGAPVWEVYDRQTGLRFTIGLYEKCEDGADGGATSPFDYLPNDWMSLPVDFRGWEE